MPCPKCAGYLILEHQDREQALWHELGEMASCLNCGFKLPERIMGLPTTTENIRRLVNRAPYEYPPEDRRKLPMHKPRHKNLGI